MDTKSDCADTFSVALPPDVECAHDVVRRRLPIDRIDPDAVTVVRRLSKFGYDAFLVGGCVRDILFGAMPKDFDVATSALPAEVKHTFRNCRLIGRRFRLAHLLFRGGKIIEVATFRRTPTNEDDVSNRHAAENLYGGPGDDAIRRDFTINALMYDVEKGLIHDYVGGLADVQKQVLRTIGDPHRRCVEDPVRIIRAAKFAAKLDLSMDAGLQEAMEEHAPAIRGCSPARLVEEVFKLLASGVSEQSLGMLHEIGVIEQLLPNLHRALNQASAESFGLLDALDSRAASGETPSHGLGLAVLMYPHVRHLLEGSGDITLAIKEASCELMKEMTFPKRHLSTARYALVAQRKLAQEPRTRRARRLVEREYFADALALAEVVGRIERSTLDRWKVEAQARAPRVLPDDKPARKNGRTRRYRSRRSYRASDPRRQS